MKALWDDVTDRLRAGADQIGVPEEHVEKGSFDEVTLRAPFVLVFLEPGDALSLGGPSGPLQFTFTVFCGAAPRREGHQAVVRAYEMARAASDQLDPLGPRWADSPIQLDTVHADFTATRLSGLLLSPT
jgi:hypothetical protein